jgi:hypothetical protein
MTRKKTIVFLLFGAMISLGACVKIEIGVQDPTAGFLVFKLRGDYAENVFIELEDGKPVVYDYMPFDTTGMWKDYPKKLVNGYWLHQDVYNPYTTVVTSIKRSEYCRDTIPVDSLLKYIIDFHPFAEFYKCRVEYYFYDDYFITSDYTDDTAKLNRVIKEGKLRKYFKEIL